MEDGRLLLLLLLEAELVQAMLLGDPLVARDLHLDLGLHALLFQGGPISFQGRSLGCHSAECFHHVRSLRNLWRSRQRSLLGRHVVVDRNCWNCARGRQTQIRRVHDRGSRLHQGRGRTV